MSRLGRVVCAVFGHADYHTTMLPEEPFGLYAYSRIWCPRCGHVEAERPIEEQIDVLMGYVTLWNDVRPVVEAARAFMGEPSAVGWDYERQGDPGPALNAALRRYESLYPEHIRP
jgi:hypothetical protein